MNKFINPPDSLASLAGCAFWIFAFSMGAAAIAAALVRVAGMAR